MMLKIYRTLFLLISYVFEILDFNFQCFHAVIILVTNLKINLKKKSCEGWT